MQKNSVVYDKYTGEICAVISDRDGRIRNAGNRLVLRTSAEINPAHWYVDIDAQTLIKRREFDTGQLNQGYYTLAVPPGTLASWNNNQYIVNDDTLSVMVNQPGTHRLILRHPHYVKKVISIENK